MSIQDTDLFLVNRDENSYKIQASNLMATLQDNDLMLVNRGGKSYKITAKEVKDDITPEVPPNLNSVTLTEQTPATSNRFTDQKFDAEAVMDFDGLPPSNKTFTAYVEGSIKANFQEPLVSTSSTTTPRYENYVDNSKPFNSGQGPNKIFDGTDQHCATYYPEDPIAFTLPTPMSGEIRVRIYANTEVTVEHAGGTTLQGYNNNNTGLRNFYLDGFFTDITKITVRRNVNSSTIWTAVWIDNVQLISLQTLVDLTFAAGTDMTTLESGDDVRQGAVGSGPSGKVGSVNANSITLQSSSGTWVVGNNVIGPLKTFYNAKKYLAFNSSGNISNLLNSPQDPAYISTDPQLTLTFPSTFPSGNTPDFELGDGTTLTVEVTASNASGSSGPKSATVQPSTTFRSEIRSLTQEEFNEQALKFATYDNRKEVQCGKMAEAQRDELIKAMAEQGYNLDDILKYL